MYHYRIITKDALGNTTTSADNTFMTNVVNGGGSGSGSSPTIDYGCKDPKATNYVSYGAISKPSLCKYPAETILPIKEPTVQVKTENVPQNKNNVSVQPTSNSLSCSVGKYLTKPIHRAFKNNPEDVKLLEKFLNTYENAGLPIDGIYSKADFDAVVKWQEKYGDEILAPWGLKK